MSGKITFDIYFGYTLHFRSLSDRNGETVQEANALGGADVITVPAMTIGLGSPLTFSSNVTVQGAGARTTILQATGGAHGMLVVPSGVVTLRGFTVTGATGIGALGHPPATKS